MPSPEETKKSILCLRICATICQFHAMISESICSSFGNIFFNVDEYFGVFACKNE
jgi:hypothetical protein